MCASRFRRRQSAIGYLLRNCVCLVFVANLFARLICCGEERRVGLCSEHFSLHLSVFCSLFPVRGLGLDPSPLRLRCLYGSIRVPRAVPVFLLLLPSYALGPLLICLKQKFNKKKADTKSRTATNDQTRINREGQVAHSPLPYQKLLSRLV